ncbi:barstar family protein [Pseudomonas viridiflava]|uniref:barstar family protein n=1 Tax=Pseudomonas viridiflava TaxID=33069 RepID=UPI0019D1AA52|nr:barstar family protein [Pseudomonas viridiflava]
MTSINYLKKASTVSIHFVRAEEIKHALDSLEGMVATGSIVNVRSVKDLFAVVASAMKFPDYFGNNWDALDECLGDMDWFPADSYCLVLREAAKGWSQAPYALGCFATAWLEAAECWAKSGTPFHLVFVM